ncbi:hypothetical protein ABQX22_25820, partial [Xanthomonas sp. WHRI 1810A]|uniref:hypothetical protein n=1 Tax=Xanthomonas sp. WHRI 1810A TaxID=3161565 RepID=UPI0032E8DBCF
RSVAGVREPDEVGPNREQGLFGYFFLGRQSGLLKKVTRCKSGTDISHTANNGYAHDLRGVRQTASVERDPGAFVPRQLLQGIA